MLTQLDMDYRSTVWKVSITEFFLVRIFTYSVRIRENTDQKKPRIWTLFTQCMSYMGPKIWGLLPKEMKQVTNLKEFKVKIKIWKLENCPFRLSRTYLQQIGFIICFLTQSNVVRLRYVSLNWRWEKLSDLIRYFWSLLLLWFC